MAPRSGVKVTKSHNTHMQELNQKALDLEKRLNAASNSANTTTEKCNKLRVPLCEILSDMILTDPAFATQNDAAGRLWRNCFYSRIGPHRSRVQKCQRKHQKLTKLSVTSATNTAEYKSQAAQAKEAADKLQSSLQFFLAEAVTLYVFICDKLQSKLASADGSKIAMSEQESETQEPPDYSKTDGVVECLHRLNIHLGDLYRYSNQLPKAENSYWTAARLGPGLGHPYNQLAVLCQLKQPEQNGSTGAPLSCVALYWYTRSLAAQTEVFETAATNLNRLLASNREWLREQQNQQPNGNAKSAQTRLFLAQFVDLHYNFFLGVSENETNADLSTIVTQLDDVSQSLSTLLRNSALGDSLLCKLVTIDAFSEHKVLGNYLKSDDNDEKAVAALVVTRIATLEIGQKMADRVLQILGKQLQNHEQANKQKLLLMPSVRVLLPLLLLCEYLYSDLATERSMSNVCDELKSSQYKQRLTEATTTFWTSVVAILNQLQSLASIFNLQPNSSKNEQSLLKEYQGLRGFGPFSGFLTPINDKGFLPDWEASEMLETGCEPNDKKVNTSQDSTATKKSSSSAGSLSSDQQNRIKVIRFLSLGTEIANDTGSDHVGPGRISLSTTGDDVPTGVFEWIPLATVNIDANEDENMLDRENDNGMVMDDNDEAMDLNDENNAEQAQSTNKNGHSGRVADKEQGSDTLVYKPGDGGGPALLVPGALLQNITGVAQGAATSLDDNQEDSYSLQKVSTPSRSGVPLTNEATSFGQRGMVGQAQDGSSPMLSPSTSRGSTGSPARYQGTMMMTSPTANPMAMQELRQTGTHVDRSMPPAPPGLQPPPGFGRPGQEQHLPSQAFRPNFAGYGLPHDFTPAATLGESLEMFGGPSALQTANPFAGSFMPSSIFGNEGNGVQQHQMGLFPNQQSYRQAPMRDGAFLGSDSNAMDGETLLDSGLLSSLLMDDGSRKPSKNPFAM